MNTEYLGKKQGRIGIKVIDENNSVHKVEVGLNGEIAFHGNDDYPHKREKRTEEQQRIMSQVEVRAQYAAQREFPKEDILEPMWDIKHLEAGLEALTRYDIGSFREEFRDFYEALDSPGQYIDAAFDLNEVEVYKVFRFQGSEIIDVAPVFLQYYDDADEPHTVGTFPDYPEDEQIVCVIPPLDLPADYDYEEQFHDIVVSHVMAQIRDLYFHMGEMPPEEYQIQGIGKLNIHGDGVGET